MKKTKHIMCALLFLLVPILIVLTERGGEGQMGMMWVNWVGPIAALILALTILNKDLGNQKTRSIGEYVQAGILAYIK